jgi:hypothetical protein
MLSQEERDAQQIHDREERDIENARREEISSTTKEDCRKKNSFRAKWKIFLYIFFRIALPLYVFCVGAVASLKKDLGDVFIITATTITAMYVIFYGIKSWLEDNYEKVEEDHSEFLSHAGEKYSPTAKFEKFLCWKSSSVLRWMRILSGERSYHSEKDKVSVEAKQAKMMTSMIKRVSRPVHLAR